MWIQQIIRKFNNIFRRKLMTDFVTAERLDSFVYLVDRISAEIELVNEISVDEREKKDKLLLPAYLCVRGKMKSRTFLLRGLKQFAHLLSSENTRKVLLGEDGIEKGLGLTIKQIELALLAILYAERIRRPLLEYWAADRIEKRIREDARKHFTQKLIPTNPDTIEQLKILIQNHKIATLAAIGNRLPKAHFNAIWNELEENKIDTRVLGLVAATYYDTPSEHLNKQRFEQAESILRNWASLASLPEQYQDKSSLVGDDAVSIILENFIISYDLPLCEVNKNDGCRTSFRDDYLIGFANFANESSLITDAINARKKTVKLFLTFHYEQARHYAFDLEKPGEYGEHNGIIRKDLLSGSEQLNKRYEFKECKVPKGVKLFEFRFKRQYAYALALGASENELDKIADAIDKQLANIVHDLTTPESALAEILGNSSLCFNPLEKYLSLAQFMRLCEVARIYEPGGAEFSIEIEGAFDHDFPNLFTIYIPYIEENKTDEDDPIKTAFLATVKKAVAAYAVNAGLCAGLSSIRFSEENRSSEWGQKLIKSVIELLKDPKAGFELLLFYIEQYDRAFDVGLWDELVQRNTASSQLAIDDSRILERKIDKDSLSIGIDIGGTAIKFGLYEKFEKLDSLRLSTQKNHDKESVKYKSLADFAKKLKEGMSKLLHRQGKDWDQIKIIGVSWPGAIRQSKIAATSGIFKHFESSVLSKLIRENTVDSIRKLEIVTEIEQILPNRNISVALCNDGFAEALARVLETPAYRSRTWGILKLGTGTAGAVISDRHLRKGIIEFGKIINNVFCRNESFLKVDYNRMPDGVVNEFISAHLLPRIFRELTGSTPPLFSSYEIGRVAQNFFDYPDFQQQNPNQREARLDVLLRDIGIDHIHTKHFAHIMSKSEFESLVFATPLEKAYEIKRTVCFKLGLDQFGLVEEHCKRIGAERMANILFEIHKKGKTEVFDNWGPTETYYNIIRKYFNDTQNKAEYYERASIIFDDIFCRAGALLADVIALIRLYYNLDGIILGGGVLANTSSSSKLIQSADKHLKAKYGIHLATLDEYQADHQAKLVGKRSFTTLYTNLNKKNRGSWIVDTQDRAEIGALYHAAIKHLMPIFKPETNVGVDSERKIQGFWPSEQFGKHDYQVVEVVALVSNADDQVALFRRNQGFSQAGQLLFQSGKIKGEDLQQAIICKDKDKDCQTCRDCIGQPLKNEVIKKAIKRELDEELQIEVKFFDDILLRDEGPIKQEAGNRSNGFMFYLAKVNVDPSKIQESKFDRAFAGHVWQPINQALKAEEINPEADDVYKEMFEWLKELQKTGQLH